MAMAGTNNVAPQQMSELSRQITLAGQGKMKFLDIVMPNGKGSPNILAITVSRSRFRYSHPT
jgi:hypothetical protein